MCVRAFCIFAALPAALPAAHTYQAQAGLIPNTMSLADLPLLFLEQLLTETDALSHTNLFHTCRRLRQVVASNVRLSQVFFLPIRPHHNAYTRLTAATRHCQKHHLQLSGTLSDESGSLESAKALIAHGVSTAEGGLLSGVQSLELNVSFFLRADAQCTQRDST